MSISSFPTPISPISPTPQPPLTKLFDAMQALIVSGMKQLLPPDFDFSSFHIFSQKQATTQLEYGWIIYDLLNHFIKTLSINLVTTFDYNALETQTQKLEKQIRGHIKLEQEIKLYLDSKARASQRQRGEYKDMRQYVQVLEGRVKQEKGYERVGIVREESKVERWTKTSNSNVNVFKRGMGSEVENNYEKERQRDVGKKPNLILNRYDSERSQSLQPLLSPKISRHLNLKKN